MIEKPSTEDSTLLNVDGLSIDVTTDAGSRLTLVDSVGFSVAPGERIAIVGESGSGKSITARAILQLDGNVSLRGSIEWRGGELLGLTGKQLTRIRGSQIGMIFQDPLSALDPTMTIGDQVAEPLITRGVHRKAAHARAGVLLEELGIPDVRRRMRAYPHEFSGGMRQRVVMALALISEPALLIADEPTTALDVRVQAQVLDLLTDIVRSRDLALILITHDFGIVSSVTDRVLVMYAGRFVEDSAVQDLLAHPAHPYSQGLLRSIPQIDGPLQTRLETMPGRPPAAGTDTLGCPFRPRCPVAVDRCAVELPILTPLPSRGAVACHVAVDSVRGTDARPA